MRLAVLFLLVCILRRIFQFWRKKHRLGYILDSPVPAKYPNQVGSFRKPTLWSPTITHNLLRSPLHSIMLVVIFFPVPPSTRQAAGPLTENLPHVCLSDRKPVDLSLERPPLEEQSVVFARVFCPWSLLCCEYSRSASNYLRVGERN